MNPSGVALNGSLQRRLRPPDQLAGDPDLQDIIALNLQRAVQLCVDLAAYVIADTNVRPPSTMAENFVILKELSVIHPALTEGMMKAVGFRNIAVPVIKRSTGKSSFRSAATIFGIQTVCSVNHSPAAIFLTLLQSRFSLPTSDGRDAKQGEPKLPESCQLTSRWRAQTWCSLVLAPCALVSRGTSVSG